MKNVDIADPNLITVTAPYDVASGGGCKVGSIFGLAVSAALSGQPVVIKTDGQYRNLPKVAGTAVSGDGVDAYWDDTNKVFTPTASTHLKVGVFRQAQLAGDATCIVRLRNAL